MNERVFFEAFERITMFNIKHYKSWHKFQSRTKKSFVLITRVVVLFYAPFRGLLRGIRGKKQLYGFIRTKHATPNDFLACCQVNRVTFARETIAGWVRNVFPRVEEEETHRIELKEKWHQLIECAASGKSINRNWLRSSDSLKCVSNISWQVSLHRSREHFRKIIKIVQLKSD